MLTRRGLLASGIAVMAARQAMGAGADGGEVHVELGDDGLHKQPWFSNTFLDLGEDLAEATAAGKDLMVLIEQNGCPYCHEMHYVNFQRPELVDYIKANPGKLTYSTAGIGSFQHLSSELFRSMTGADMIHVPFKGGGPAMQSTIAGETNVNIGTLVQQIPQIQAGRLKVLGVGSSERNGALPDVPTIDEAGVPGYLASNWWGILAPTGTPEAIVDQVSEALAKVVESDDIKKALSDQGAAAMKMNPAEFAAFMTAEMEKWAKVVKDAGIEPN